MYDDEEEDELHYEGSNSILNFMHQAKLIEGNAIKEEESMLWY